jgi:hypothetical protein
MTVKAVDINVSVGTEAPVEVEAEGPSVAAQYPSDEYIPEGDETPPAPLDVAEPDMVALPSGDAQVYMLSNTAGVYFYGGYWYRYHHGVWFRARMHNVPWGYIHAALVPGFVIEIPPAYPLYLPAGYYRIPYRDFDSQWRSWDRDRRWQKEGWFQNERRADVSRDRIRRANLKMEEDRRLRAERIRIYRAKGGPGFTGGAPSKKAPSFRGGEPVRKGAGFKGNEPMKQGPAFKGGEAVKKGQALHGAQAEAGGFRQMKTDKKPQTPKQQSPRQPQDIQQHHKIQNNQ